MTDKHTYFQFLELLKQSGIVDMQTIKNYLVAQFDLTFEEAEEIFSLWKKQNSQILQQNT